MRAYEWRVPYFWVLEARELSVSLRYVLTSQAGTSIMLPQRISRSFMSMPRKRFLLMQQSRGEEVIMIAYVDASHASNKKTRRSHTGYLIFINMAPIVWYSKRQRTVESSSFGSK